jgi:hypothetical protein
VDNPGSDAREAAWRALLGEEVEVLRLPGGHMDQVRSAMAPHLAAEIWAWLDRLDRERDERTPEADGQADREAENRAP